MKTKFIEVTNGPQNHGKFCLAVFDGDEWARPSLVDRAQGNERLLVQRCGWGNEHLWVMDMQTGEGAYMRHGGYAVADLAKHAVWVCPMFEPFLTWLWDQPLSPGGVLDWAAVEALPGLVDLPDAPFSFAGYRRPGREELEALRDADFVGLPSEALVASIHYLAERLLALGPEGTAGP